MPFRLQDDFAQLYKIAGLEFPIATDLQEILIDQLSPSKAPTIRMDTCQLYAVKNKFLDQYIPDVQSVLLNFHLVLKLTYQMVVNSNNLLLSSFEQDYAKIIENAYNWKFDPIGDHLMLKAERQREYENKQLQDPRKAKKLIWQRQNLSAWFVHILLNIFSI